MTDIDIERWEPPSDREWTEAEHWRWTAEHHREFRVRAEEERATLRQQLAGAMEALGKINDLAKYLAEPAWTEEGIRLVGEQIVRLAGPHLGGSRP